MSQNQEQQKKAAPKKKFSFVSFFITLIIILAIIIGCYFAFFPNKKVELPFLSKEVENKINTYIENPSKIFTPENNAPAESGNRSEGSSQSPQSAQSAYDKANEIFQKMTTAQPAQQTAPANPEDNLTEHDMAEQQANAPKIADDTTSGSFSLEPPSTIAPLEGGRRMLTEEEIAEAQEKDRQNKLAKLNELRSEQSTAIHDTDNLLPTKQGSLSALTPDSSLDPVVTLFFIQDLADYLINNYRFHANGSTAVTMPRLNQRYGVGLIGLEHSSGRAGVLDYAYNENMIPVLYKHLSPVLIKTMQILAERKEMPLAEQEKMFKVYANQSRLYADAIRTLINVPQLSENIQNLVAIEKDLKQEENSFAENLLQFEQNRDDDTALARSYEEKVKQSTVRSAQLKTRVSNVKNDLRQYLIQYDAKLANVPNCLELALWLDRRKNPAASIAFANALDNFANDVSALPHE